VEKAWRRLPGAVIFVVLSTINLIPFRKTIDLQPPNPEQHQLPIDHTATTGTLTSSTTTMDVQSLESRFEGISVNDENHDQNSHKSKVGCCQRRDTRQQELRLTPDTGIDINL
jgi:hypothetical protein